MYANVLLKPIFEVESGGVQLVTRCDIVQTSGVRRTPADSGGLCGGV